ncbi:hypothetical protein [Paenibacillus darwinianus]|uniref:hypothetical protein n=1 Tax=Paenibacillus darwinianus TaxID=1380763 RepID=UPI000A9DC056|nr:hypothetical protein [Paenibacillus darwinianus]
MNAGQIVRSGRVYDEELDNAAIVEATKKYAELYGMPAEQIHAVRLLYGIGYRPTQGI